MYINEYFIGNISSSFINMTIEVVFIESHILKEPKKKRKKNITNTLLFFLIP